MLLYVSWLLLAVLFFNIQTFPCTNGTPSDTNDPSSITANTESEGLLNWVPKWCKKGYNDLFGDNGIITAIMPSFLKRQEKAPIECCCRLASNQDQSTTGKDVREITKDKNNKCFKAVGKVSRGTASCVGGVGWVCGKFVVDACTKMALLGGGLVYAVGLGCSKVVSCFKCGGS